MNRRQIDKQQLHELIDAVIALIEVLADRWLEDDERAVVESFFGLFFEL